MENTGLIYVFTGDGKGKTSASLGVTMRALANGMKVAIVQWYKDPAWKISEHNMNKLLNDEAQSRFALYPMGVGFHIPTTTAPLSNGGVVIDKASEEAHHQAAENALKKAEELITQVDVLVLDEINNAISDSLIPLISLNSLISRRGSTHLILTGRNAHPELIKIADLVTSMDKVKHPYDHGKLAIKGLDF